MSAVKGKNVLITGATRGIGQGLMRHFAQEGAYVIGTATSAAGAASINEFIEANNYMGQAVLLDITNTEAIDTLLIQLTEENKVPQVLINNAGITEDDLLLRMSDQAWHKVINTNLNGVFYMTRACIKPMFRARWGRIINIGSVVGSSGNAGQANYTASKAAIIGFSKSLAQELGSRGVTINVIAPGFIDTDMTKNLPDMVKAEMLKRIPMKRLGTVEDIAGVAAFLASDAANYITGITLHVNGGMYMS